MQDKFTLKNVGRFLRTLSILAVLACSFAGASAQCVWTSAPVFPTTGLDMPVAAVGTNMYSFGGVHNGAIVATSFKFDGTAWTSIAPVPAAVEFASAASNGTDIYVTGGALVGTGAPQTTHYRYNVGTNTYTTLTPCGTGTWNHASVFLNGKIYKIGGTGALAAVNNVEIYDIAAGTWTAGAAYPQAASFISAVAIGNFIYAAGGNVANIGTNKTYRYDPIANTWDDASIADLPATRWGAAAANYRGFTIAGGYVGGDATPNISTSTISWDPATNVWTTQAAMPGERSRMTGAVLNDALYVLGGRSVASAAFVGTNSNYKYTCPPLFACSGTPAPGNTFASSIAVCSGTPVTLTTQNSTGGTGVTYQWQVSPTGAAGSYVNAPGASTNPSYTATPAATGFYQVQVTCGANVGTSTPIQITVSPCTCLTPDIANICEGQIQQISISGAGVVGTPVTVSSGPITVNIPDSDPNGITTPLTVALPAGASITGVSVNFNLTHTWDADMSINLVAPNGQVLNLVNAEGGSGDNFVNTTISSAGTIAMNTQAPPFSAIYKADAVIGVGPTAFLSAATGFPALYTVPNGQWRLALRDVAGGDLGILTSWSLTFNYVTLPTATWTGGIGTIFTNPAATTPYVAGTQANTVYVLPSVTTVYTANISSGPCAGANTATVTVRPRPVVTLSPTSGCGPLTITASGAATYTFSPGTGLNNTTGPIVVANPNTTTTYTVIGTGTNGCTSTPVSATVNSAPTASVISPVAGSVFQLQEGFTTVPPAGWARQNLSVPLATTAPFNNWTQGDPLLFTAFNGPTNSYALANFQATTGVGTISNWLFTPVLNIKNGDVISFYTRTTTGATFPDRMEVRMNTTNNGTNVGTTATSVGDFTTLLLTVNPNLVAGPGTGTGTSGYPDTWTRLTATVSGVTGTVPGRFAFRHFVTNGGPAGANSDNIGLDQVEYSSPASVNCANVVTNIKVDITGGVGPYTVVFSNGTTSTTITGYTSGTNIQVSPAVTTNYTIVSVTGANGCVGTGNSGTATVTITPPASITTQPVATSVCVGGNATITVASGPITGNTFQWQVSTNGGTTYTNLTNTAPYSGVTTNTLTITGATAAMNGYLYRVRIQGSCGAAVTSAAAALTVNTPAVITQQPVATISLCNGTGSTLTVTATGNQLTYQWQVSTDGGLTFTNLANGANYSGVTTNTLTLINVPASFANYRYRVQVTSAGCALVNSSATTIGTVFPTPVVVISAAPITNLFPGLTTTLTAAVSPNAAVSYQWLNNGVPVPGATSNMLTVGIDGIGTYTVRVTDVNGCTNGITSTPASITISGDSATDILFIYPSPNSGRFQVRFFNDLNYAQGSPGVINVYDSKGARVFTRRYSGGAGGYQPMQVDLGATHGKGIYRVDFVDNNGNRLKTGSVLIF